VSRPRSSRRNLFDGFSHLPGRCNVCGKQTEFFYLDPALYRESLVCAECLTTSRYRSIARGILKAIEELKGVRADSLSALASFKAQSGLRVYDAQAPFYFERCAYPVPDLLSKCSWLDVHTSLYRPNDLPGAQIGPKTTNQNLEALTYADQSFDIVITSDVMEHVRLDDRAHREIQRVLRPGGVYLFTVPHFRDRRDTFVRVQVTDPSDPSKDVFLTGEFRGWSGAQLSILLDRPRRISCRSRIRG
jgi:SAM-dependent methyltransferase